MSSPARSWANHALALALIGAGASGCATGSSASLTQAPIFFSGAGGAFPDAAASLPGAVLSAGGDFKGGVPEFVAFGGNAILPVNAPAALGVTDTLVGTLSSPASTLAPAGGPVAGLATTVTAPTVALAPTVAPTAAVAALATQGSILSGAGAGLSGMGASPTSPGLLVTTAVQQQKARMCGPLKLTC